MLPTVEPANAWLQAVQVIALAAIAAWVGIYGRKLDAGTRELKAELAAEKTRCDGLEKRVKALERKRRKPPKPRPK